MRVISKAALRDFWKSRKSNAKIAERDLTAWYKIASARDRDWDNFADLKRTFGSADRVGNCTVFDVGNNRFRLVARVIHRKSTIYILRVMDHEEYDKGRWLDQCDCHEPSPLPSSAPPKRSRKR